MAKPIGVVMQCEVTGCDRTIEFGPWDSRPEIWWCMLHTGDHEEGEEPVADRPKRYPAGEYRFSVVIAVEISPSADPAQDVFHVTALNYTETEWDALTDEQRAEALDSYGQELMKELVGDPGKSV